MTLVGERGEITAEMMKKLHSILHHLNSENIPTEEQLVLQPQSNNDRAVAFYFCAVAILIQKAANSSVSTFKYEENKKPGNWEVFVEHEHDTIGYLAAQFSCKLIRQILADPSGEMKLAELITSLENQVAWLKQRYAGVTLPKEVRSILKAAEKRHIPWRNVPKSSLFQYGYGRHLNFFRGTILANERHSSVLLTNDKALTNRLLHEAGLPIAQSGVATTLKQAAILAEKIGYPVVVKPLSGMRGNGVTLSIRDENGLTSAIKKAGRYDHSALIEKHTEGNDFRLTVFGGKLVGAIKRSVTIVEGDGQRNILELAEEVNREPWRNKHVGDTKYHIKKISVATECLESQGHNWESVPVVGERVAFNFVPNVSEGGCYETIWKEMIHRENIKMAERAAKTVGLQVAGIDFLTTDILKPYWETGAIICEVNAQPAFELVFERDQEYLDEFGRIAFETSCPLDVDMTLPVVSMVSDGKELSGNIVTALQKIGLVVGYWSQEFASVDDVPIRPEGKNNSSVSSILWNGSVEVAVLEVNALRIQKKGLEYNICSHLVVENMPMIEGVKAPEVLDLILSAVTHKVIVNKENSEVFTWANSARSDKIIFTAKGNLQTEVLKELSAEFPDLLFNVTGKFADM